MGDSLNQQVGILTRREIEARILKPLLAKLETEVGPARAYELLAEVIEDMARGDGADMATAVAGRDLEAFASAWEPWFRGGALTIEEHALSQDRWRFDVTRCRYAELYRELGLADVGSLLSCNRDAALIEGFSSEVVLERTQTLMEGATHCDFHYRRRDSDPE